MTTTPYAVSGIIYDTDGTTALSGAVVGAKNVNTGEFLSASNCSVSNTSGQYTIDLANFSSGYTNGDSVEILVFDPKNKRYSIYETVINSDIGSEEEDITTSAYTYTTPAKLSALLGGTKFNMFTNPSLSHIADMIVEAEDDINRDTFHSWKEVSVSNEYHTMGDYHYDNGRQVFLNHRAVKTLDTSEGDKIEVWNGSDYVDWVADKTEGRGSDYWVEYILGILHLKLRYVTINSVDKVRVTYRYGESTVPKDVQKACTMLTGIKFLTGEDRSIKLPEGANTNIDYNQKKEIWQKEIDRVISSRSEMITVDE